MSLAKKKPKTSKDPDMAQMECNPEEYFKLLKKTYVGYAKKTNSTVSKVWYNAVETVLKDKTNPLIVPCVKVFTFTQADLDTAPALLELFTKAYPMIRRLYFSQVTMTDDLMELVVQFLLASPKWRPSGGIAASSEFYKGIHDKFQGVFFTNCQLTPNQIKLYMQAVPLSLTKKLQFVGMPMGSETLLTLGSTIDRYISQCKQNAQQAIDEDNAKFREQEEKIAADEAARLAKIAANPKKKIKKKKVKRYVFLNAGKAVTDIYKSYFKLEAIQLSYCHIGVLESAALGYFIEKLVPYIQNISLVGNRFGAVGLGEIGAGIQRAALKFEKDELAIRAHKRVEELETYHGNSFLQLQVLDISHCCIQEDIPEAYRAFADGIASAGRLQAIDFRGNVMAGQFKWLIPSFLIQKRLCKVTYPPKYNMVVAEEVTAQLRIHLKTLQTWGKLAKKLNNPKYIRRQLKLAEKAAKEASDKAAKEAEDKKLEDMISQQKAREALAKQKESEAEGGSPIAV